jgi:hypothetical protein
MQTPRHSVTATERISSPDEQVPGGQGSMLRSYEAGGGNTPNRGDSAVATTKLIIAVILNDEAPPTSRHRRIDQSRPSPFPMIGRPEPPALSSADSRNTGSAVSITSKTTQAASSEDKKRGRMCKADGCPNYIVHKGLCCRHGVSRCCWTVDQTVGRTGCASL